MFTLIHKVVNRYKKDLKEDLKNDGHGFDVAVTADLFILIFGYYLYLVHFV